MADGARSSHPGVRRQLDRLAMRGPGRDVLGLDRIRRLLARLGDPHEAIPPVFHVAGTNGKGSTVALLRAMLEATGHRVHVYTSPHLVRFNERIRVAGALIDDDRLAATLEEVIDHADGLDASFFEITTAVAFRLFAETPGDACIVEVGLGGRLDATNVLAAPLVCGIASLGIDHHEFLLAPEIGVPDAPLARIAFEKAGIAKPGVPLVTQGYAPEAMAAIAAVASTVGARWLPRGAAWQGGAKGDGLHYRDPAGALSLPSPTLGGAHQADNALLATAMVRHQGRIAVPDQAIAAGLRAARWPARLQRLGDGPLLRSALITGPVWLDGGHNVDAARRIGDALAARVGDRPFTLILGMLANKDASGFLDALAERLGTSGTIRAVPVPDHAAWPTDAMSALAKDRGWPVSAHAGVEEALAAAAGDAAPVAILGSLYLAGEVLRLNDQLPD